MKYFLIVLVLLAGLAVYLNRAYAHIFSFVGSRNPGNPTSQLSVTITTPPTAPATAALTYVALGDSLTAGVGAAQESESYPYRLAEILAEKQQKKVTLVNLGQPGATSGDVLNKEVPLVAVYHPDIITLAIGVNDLHDRIPRETFQENLAAIVRALTPLTKHLNVITIPYLGSRAAFWPPFRAYFDWQTRQYNVALRQALVGQTVSLIDLYRLTHEHAVNDPEYYSADGFHPSAEAYDFWSTTIYDHLNY